MLINTLYANCNTSYHIILFSSSSSLEPEPLHLLTPLRTADGVGSTKNLTCPSYLPKYSSIFIYLLGFASPDGLSLKHLQVLTVFSFATSRIRLFLAPSCPPPLTSDRFSSHPRASSAKVTTRDPVVPS